MYLNIIKAREDKHIDDIILNREEIPMNVRNETGMLYLFKLVLI